MQKYPRLAVIAAVLLALLIPLRMIGGIVSERAERQQAVMKDIAASGYARQTVAGLVLTLPYTEEYEETLSEGPNRRTELKRIARTLQVFPDRARTEGTAGVETKSRGIFKVRVYQWQGTMQGEFRLDNPSPQRSRPLSRITWGQPYVSLLLSDPRGLMGTPQLTWAGQPVVLERGSALPGLAGGVHARLPALDPGGPQRIAYSLKLGIRGTDTLAFVPVAAHEQIQLRSDWPHPRYDGQFLPTPGAQQQALQGSEASWSVSALSSQSQQALLRQFASGAACAEGLCADRMEVRFIEPIDIYSLSDRATKYGFLFIGLTFASLFLLELLKRLPVHPAQYLLVGLALATFFLLLVALSEHIAFGLAYSLATLACVTLLAVYLSAVLGSRTRGAGFAAMIATLYGLLYALLISEDNALLLGALLVFALLAAAMMLTRHLDWTAAGAAARISNSPTGAQA